MSETSASSNELNKPKNRRFRVPSNPWLPYIGDCRALEKYLNSKQGIGWLIPKYLNALLRGISQVVFANNPLAGLVILVALFWSDVYVGLGATVAGTTAILTALLMRQHPDLISSGLTTYNAVLVGSVTSSLWTPLYGEVLGTKLWSFIILGAALSVFVTSATASILSSLKVPLPALTLPFNLVTVLIFICLMPVPQHRVHDESKGLGGPVALRLQQSQPHLVKNYFEEEISKGTNDQIQELLRTASTHSRYVRDVGSKQQHNTTKRGTSKTEDEEIMDWGKILLGIISAAGQVYGVNDMIASVLIYIGVMIYSPMLFMMSVFGAILGTICGTFFEAAPYTAIYTGLWGYNGILSATAVGGLFIVLTCHSFWNAMVNVVFTVLIQQALSIAFSSSNLPYFTLPFVLSTFLFLSVTTSGNQLPRVDKITFPEMHRYNYRESNRVKRLGKSHQKCHGEIADAEEKELVLTDVKVIGEEVVVAQVEVAGDDGGANAKGKDDDGDGGDVP